MDILSLLGLGITAFAATDIDDLSVLMLFFSNPAYYRPRQVVFGQYLGIGALVVASLLGSLIALVVPYWVVGLMGLLPLAIGIKKLIDMVKDDTTADNDIQKNLPSIRKTYLPFLTVAGVTIANGGDNLGVYVPLFAHSNTNVEVLLLVAIFLVITAVWCALAYFLVNHRAIAERLRSKSRIILPLVLIALGGYILADAFLYSS